MALFDKALKTAKNIGNSVANSAVNAGSNAGVAVQEQSELAGLKMQVNVIEEELNSAYAQIGRKYVEYVIETQEMPQVDVSDTLRMAESKLEKRKELEKQIIELEKRIKQKNLLREKEQAEEEFRNEKQKLDRALSMEVLTQDDYNKKLATAQKKVDNFEEIRRTEQQFDMGLITREEKEAKIKTLTE
ncbi:hypothetical protein [Dorea sp. D27]|uniref:hypothetical protein n=1 Tax=Dorea sp. D27 TaxID=658665 RepID=UPI000673212E|nr:hypothetical protein [Dorea sp. D27]KMZ55782.1 hypothetical protein HMPREF0980_00078 [Dorea sp. D27]